MATVYILYSNARDTYYIGSCDDFNSRLEQHRQGIFETSFTKRATDWETFCLVEKLEYQQARGIEKHIKRMKSRVYIENLKSYPSIIEKLKERYK